MKNLAVPHSRSDERPGGFGIAILKQGSADHCCGADFPPILFITLHNLPPM